MLFRQSEQERRGMFLIRLNKIDFQDYSVGMIA